MKKFFQCTAFALLAFAALANATASVKVTYANPGKMTDVPRNKSDLDAMESALSEHFARLAAQLPAGQDLKVDVLDIDLAGDVFPRVAVQNIRVYRDRADWPHMRLRFSIEQNGKVLRSGERDLSDAAYMMGGSRYGDDMFRFEKKMLDKWFSKELAAKP